MLFHTDAVQAVGKVEIDLSSSPINFLSLCPRTNFTDPKESARFMSTAVRVSGRRSSVADGKTDGVPELKMSRRLWPSAKQRNALRWRWPMKKPACARCVIVLRRLCSKNLRHVRGER